MKKKNRQYIHRHHGDGRRASRATSIHATTLTHSQSRRLKCPREVDRLRSSHFHVCACVCVSVFLRPVICKPRAGPSSAFHRMSSPHATGHWPPSEPVAHSRADHFCAFCATARQVAQLDHRGWPRPGLVPICVVRIREKLIMVSRLKLNNFSLRHRTGPAGRAQLVRPSVRRSVRLRKCRTV